MDTVSYIKTFIRYASLSILGILGVSCYILADTFFIAQGLGADGLAALNIAIPVYNFIHGTGLMFGMGGATIFSILQSRQTSVNGRQADACFSNTLYLACAFGLLFAASGLLFSGPLAAALGADHKIFDMTTTYLKWLMLFSPAFILNDVLLCFVRNDGNPLLSTIAMLTGSFANIILDYILIFPMRLGIFGAVFATSISPIFSICIMSLHWFQKKHHFHLVKTAPRLRLTKEILSLGFPSLIGQIASGISMIVFNLLILKLEGNVGVAAYGVVANIAFVVVSIYTGMAQGVQPLISHSYGSGDKKGIRLGYRCSMYALFLFSIVLYLTLFLFAEPITAIFNSENNLRLQEISVIGIKLYFSSILFTGYNTILAVFFTSTENPIPAHLLSMLRGFLLLVPAAFFLSSLWHMTGLWLTCTIVEGAAAVLGYAIYRHSQNSRST